MVERASHLWTGLLHLVSKWTDVLPETEDTDHVFCAERESHVYCALESGEGEMNTALPPRGR